MDEGHELSLKTNRKIIFCFYIPILFSTCSLFFNTSEGNQKANESLHIHT